MDEYIEITIKDSNRKFTRAIAKSDLKGKYEPYDYILNEATVMIRDFTNSDSELRASASGGEAL